MVKPNHLTVHCESCSELVRPETPAYRMHFIAGFMAVLGGAGFLFGLVSGLATFGTAFIAWPIFLVLGLYAGYKVGGRTAEYFDGYSCPECGEYFTAPSVVSKARSLVPV